MDRYKKLLGLKDTFDLDKILVPNKLGYLVVGHKELYRIYSKCNLKYNRVTNSLYVKLLKFIFMKIWEAIITEAWQFILPFRLGRIYIYTPISHTNKYIDWKSSKLLGKKVARLNLHTGGKTFKVRWNKQLTTIKHLTVYNFKPARGEYGDKYVGTRGIARYIIETSNDPLKKNFRAHLI